MGRYLTTLGVLLAVSVEVALSQLVGRDEFNNACAWNGYPVPDGSIYDAFSAEIWRSEISSKQEAAMAITHFLHESDGFRARREYRCEQTGCPGEYETADCDVAGQDYYGRGFIQLTWCYNYRDASWELYNDPWLVSQPDAAASDVYVAWQTSMWFWKSRVHNAPGVQDGHFGASTRAINGALECDGPNQNIARQRFEMYKNTRNALNLGGEALEWGCYN